jgi:hypothetical protein
MLLSVIEIAIFIVLPLIIFFKRRGMSPRYYVPAIFFLYLAWYLTYALLHEASHLVGIWLTGTEITDYQLIPHFWKGDFNTGFIRSDYQSEKDEFFIVIAAYLRDILFLIAGAWLLSITRYNKIYLIALILTFFLLSPLYDIVNNYSAYLFGAQNDFYALGRVSSRLFANIAGISFSLFACLAFYVSWKTYLMKQPAT